MLQELNLNSIIVKTDNFIESELDDGIVMMSIENNSYYGLDEIGKKIIALTNKPIEISEITTTLLSEYNIDKEICERDVLELIKDLQKEGIIQFAD